MSEQILVVKASILEEQLGGFALKGGVYTLAVNQAFYTLYHMIVDNLEIIDRDLAEKDETLKQIIPYIVVKRVFGDSPKLSDNTQQILKYERTKKAGESRLHNKWSIGFGGHMNLLNDGKDVVRANAMRELNEELELPKGNLFPLGFIYDSTNEVGRVHLGIVFEYELEGHKLVEAKEDQLTGLEWLKPSELKAGEDRLESWSKIALEEFLK
jgi:predicted NUDIX family phosphoesterase